MSSDGLGNVAPVQKGRGKIHILSDYLPIRYKLSDVSDTRCGKHAGEWSRLTDKHCLRFMSDPESCATCVRMLQED